MIRGTRRTFRYGHSWLTGRAQVEEREVAVECGDRSLPATLLLPRTGAPPFPGWVVLHGITRPGRRHAQLVRFARSLAATRSAVLIPEVPEWVDLQLAPELTVDVVRAGLDLLERLDEVRGRPAGLIGFSFGAPQAAIAATREGVAERVSAVVGFGGYCDLERTLRFQFTGEHEWEGVRRRVDPDPYGRWIVGANVLTRVPGHGDAEDVARGLHALAAEAGDRGLVAWDPAYDPTKEALRQGIASSRRDLWDLFAPPTRHPSRGDAVEPLVTAMAAAARLHSPLLEPAPHFPGVGVPVQLLHGRGDRLIPFTESLRMHAALPPAARTPTTVTRLFAHSTQDALPGFLESLWEGAVFVNALRRVLRSL